MIEPLEQYNGLNITFNTTEDCNLKCEYCYEISKNRNDLPLEYAERFIDIILSDSDPVGVAGTDKAWLVKSGLIMDFIGGDALMRPELVERILRYFIFASQGHKWGHRWRASISTNGTLFGVKGVKEFLEDFRGNISLTISIDGCPEIHNLNRDNSMDRILPHWNWYLKYVGEDIATTKATLNRRSIPYIYQSLKYMHETLNLRRINQNFIFEPLGETKEDLQELNRQMELCVEYVLLHRRDLYWSMIDKRFSSAGCMKNIGTGWCGSGAMPALGINGKIYPCFRFLPHTMHSRELDFSVGDVWKGLVKKENFCIIRAQTREKISEEKCFRCDIESECSWCIGGAFSESGRFYRQTNICDVMKIQAKWAKEYWREYGRDN